MNYIEKKLEKRREDISFIQIKSDSPLAIEDYNITDYPLPIITSSLIQEVKINQAEEIELEKIIDGIIFLLGVGDSDFPYIDQYRSLLKRVSPEIEEIIFFRAMTSFKDEDIDNSLINIRALLSLNPENVKALFQYGIVLEEIGRVLIDEEDIKDGEEILKLSTLNFEKILNVDEEYALAYYKLGYHYRYSSQSLKTDLIWTKFLKFSEDEILKEEIREELAFIKDEVNLETAITYISYSDYKKALDSLLNLLPKHEESWNVNYLIGKSYNGMGEFESAIKYFNQAIKYNREESELYNELGVVYYNIGEIYKAMQIFTEGIQHCQEDYRLIFNRSLMYAGLEDYKKALEDAEKAYGLEPDESIRAQIEWLREQV